MNINNIQDLINIIPLFFQYFVPGIVFLYIHSIYKKKKLSESNYWISAGIITFILIILFELVTPNWECPYMIRAAILTVISFVVAVFVGKINTLTFTKKITTFLFQQTFTQNIWEDVIDYKNGCYMNVYLKGKDYYINGTYDYSTFNSDDKWLSLIYFEKRNSQTDEIIPSKENYRDNENAHIVIRFEDIDYIEVDNDVEK